MPPTTTTTTTMPTATTPRHITLDLLRKRSEHNEGLVSTLEELALHQEELEAVGPILGRTCGRTLKILLLQNNVIAALHPGEMKMLKSLEYLNLALNNLTAVPRGVLDRCEFLEKLDLTLNFIDVDELESTVDGLVGLRSLVDLYLIGNPCSYSDVGGSGEDGDGGDVVGQTAAALQVSSSGGKPKQQSPTGWRGCRPYVIARLPNLRSLDGQEILRSERILANQQLPDLVVELRDLAKAKRVEKELLAKKKEEEEEEVDIEFGASDDDEEDLTEHTPEVRATISREMAEQKAAKEEQERSNMPKQRGEKEYAEEQATAIEKARNREERGNIKQCNEGKWQFRFDEETKPGYVLLDVPIQKFLSSSLVDVDVHPTYVSIVIKGRVLRLVLPAEVKSDESTAQRSTTTGHLLLTMPKVDPKENMVSVRAARKYKEEMAAKKRAAGETRIATSTASKATRTGLASDMIEEATNQLKGSVRIEGLVDEKYGGVKQQGSAKSCSIDMKAVSSTRKAKPQDDVDDTKDDDEDSDEPPAMY